MNREDIIKLAKEVGWIIRDDLHYMDHQAMQDALIERIERFAALVAAAERESWPAEMEAMERQVNILTDALAQERKAMMQLFTDPENQPTQHGTVTVEYLQREIAAERERFALECIDLVALHGGPVDLEAAIRARGETK